MPSELARELLFRVSIADCETQTYRGSGAGGQHRNKTSSGVRIIHHPSGARAESCETRSQADNKRRAFRRMVVTDVFEMWRKMEAARLMGRFPEPISDIVDRQIQETIVEVRENGRWVEAR